MKNLPQTRVKLTDPKLIEAVYKAFEFKGSDTYICGKSVTIRQDENQISVEAKSDSETRILMMYFSGDTIFEKTWRFSGSTQTTLRFTDNSIKEIFNGIETSMSDILADMESEMHEHLVKTLSPLIAPAINRLMSTLGEDGMAMLEQSLKERFVQERYVKKCIAETNGTNADFYALLGSSLRVRLQAPKLG